MTEVAEKIIDETFCWVCRSCYLEGPWQTDPDKIPRGWKDCPVNGVNCKRCSKPAPKKRKSKKKL